MRRDLMAMRRVVAVLTAMVVIGSVGGYVLGREAGERTVTSVQTGAGDDEAAVAHGDAAGRDDAASGAGGGDAASLSYGSSGFSGDGYPIFEDLTEVARRRTTHGIEIRGYTYSYPAPDEEQLREEYGVEGGADAWIPPVSCFATTSLRADFFDGDFAGSLYAEYFATDEPLAVRSLATIGNPAYGFTVAVAAQVTDGTVVRLERDGAVLDEARGTGGWAVLATAVDQLLVESPFGDGVEVVALDPNGTELARQPAERTVYGPADPACQPPPPPPPELPAGVEPVTDPELRAQIEAAYGAVFDRDGDATSDARPDLQNGDLLDDEFMAAVRDGAASYGIGAVTLVLHDLGIVDEDHVLVVFELDGAPVGWQIGGAVRVDGEWKVAIETFCDLVAVLEPCPEAALEPFHADRDYLHGG